MFWKESDSAARQSQQQSFLVVICILQFFRTCNLIMRFSHATDKKSPRVASDHGSKVSTRCLHWLKLWLKPLHVTKKWSHITEWPRLAFLLNTRSRGLEPMLEQKLFYAWSIFLFLDLGWVPVPQSIHQITFRRCCCCNARPCCQDDNGGADK